MTNTGEQDTAQTLLLTHLEMAHIIAACKPFLLPTDIRLLQNTRRSALRHGRAELLIVIKVVQK